VKVIKNASNEIEEVHCSYDPETKSGTVGSKARKVKGNIHWLSTKYALKSEVRLFDSLFSDSRPDVSGREYKKLLGVNSKEIISAYIEPSLNEAVPEEFFQFERSGYFVADQLDMKTGRPVFNRTVTLRDSRGKYKA
jgi:glutaminyl-tRNA synthetase